MVAKQSAIVLESFVIMDSKCAIILSDSADFQPIETTRNFPIEIDFHIEKENNTERYRIFTKVEINNGIEKESGYSISTKGLGFFSFDQSKPIDENEKLQLLEYSGLSICITNLRSYIANQTSYFPWGNFTFHSVDVSDLLSEKNKEEQ